MIVIIGAAAAAAALGLFGWHKGRSDRNLGATIHAAAILALLVLVLFLTASCATGQAATETAFPVEVTPVAGDSESYRFKQIQTAWTKEWAKLLQTGFGVSNYTKGSYVANHWSRTHQYIPMGVVWDGGANVGFGLWFHSPRYTSDSKLVYGQARTISDQQQNATGEQAILEDDNGVADLTHKIERSFELSHSVESTFSREFSFDVTVSSTSKASVGGEVYGGSFEQELSTTFGTSFSQQEAETKAESETTTHTVDDEVTVPLGKKAMITFSHQVVAVEQPFTVDGYLDFAIGFPVPTRFNGDGWHGRVANGQNLGYANAGFNTARNWWTMHFSGIEALSEFFGGVDTNWSQMEGWFDNESSGVQATVGWLLDNENRVVKLTGTQTREGQEAVTLTVLDVTGCSDTDLDEINAQLDTEAGATPDYLTSAFGCVENADHWKASHR